MSPALQERLPTAEFALGSAVCPPLRQGFTVETNDEQRAGMRQLAVLIRALDAQPDSTVTASYSLADPEPGERRDQTEEISVRELAQGFIDYAPNEPCRRELSRVLGPHIKEGAGPPPPKLPANRFPVAHVKRTHLGLMVADSGPRFGGEAAIAAKIRGHKKVFLKVTTRPPQPVTGYSTVNCFAERLRTVFHRDNGLPLIRDGFLIQRVNLPERKRYIYCAVTPDIYFSTPEATGELRARLFVKR